MSDSCVPDAFLDADDEPAAHRRHGRQQGDHHGQREQCLVAPGHQRLVLAECHSGYHRVAVALAEGVQPLRAVQLGAKRRGARCGGVHVVAHEVGRLRKVAAHVLLAVGVAHQQLPGGGGQADGAAAADVDGSEGAQEVFQAQRHHDHAGEPVLAVFQAPADGDHPFAAAPAADRRADEDLA
jgi:hypothetical protein